MKLIEKCEHVYCIVEKEDFTNSWFEYAKGGELSPTYVDFFTEIDSAKDSLRELIRQNPEMDFDILKTEYSNFCIHWNRSTNWAF